MNTIDAIYTRHQRSLMAVDQATDVVLFSLRLALEELAASTPSTPSTNGNPRQADMDRAQLDRLNDWLAEHAPNAYHEPGDTADAIITVLESYRSFAQSPISNLDPPPNPPPAPLPIDLSSLAPDELNQVVAVQSGENTWRTLPKDLRKKVILLALRQLASAKGSRIDTKQWDELRPPWMPGNNAIALTLQCKWSEIPQE